MSISTYRRREDQNLWNFLSSIFFIVVLIVALCIIWRVRGEFPSSLPWLDLVLMVFATLRITRLIVYDKIARWFRELFMEKRHIEKEGVAAIELKPFEGGIRHTIYDLLQCPWCISVWSALAVVFCYFIFPWGWMVILLLAVSGAGSLLQIISNMIGWHAEDRKHEMQRKSPSPSEF
jgi:hypothetical protein